MSDLKPCPACGGKAVMFRANLHAWRVEHALGGECCLTMGCESTPDEAANFWNSLPRREEHREELMALLQMGAIGPQLRDEDRERRRFEAAVALLATMATRDLSAASAAEMALHYADALLAELAKERP